MVTTNPDLYGAAAHLSMIDHLSGPMVAGAQDVGLPISAAGRIDVNWSAREPLVVVTPRQPLGDTGLRLRGVVTPGGAVLEPLEFATYSEAGAYLPLYRPVVAESTGTTAPFRIDLALARIGADGTETAVATAGIAALIEVRLIEGVLGRLIFALGAEKARIRRHAREIASLRLLDQTRLAALDRLGSDLAVPRFADNLIAKEGAIITETRREPDAEYRRRLAIYKPFLLPNRARLLELLNGPGPDNSRNAGLLGGLGQPNRLAIEEQDNEFAVAIHLVSAGNDAQRLNFLDHVRKVRLVQPRNDPAANQAHAARFLPSETRQEAQALRLALRNAFGLSAGAAIAPMLATALDRVRRCRIALGVTTAWPVLRTQDSTAGSRYELGLGLDLALLSAAELNGMRTRLTNPGSPPATDPETEALLKSMTPLSAADDPEGRWLLAPCGMATVHRVDTTRIYVSHFPTFGLAITAPSNVPLGGRIDLEARYHAPGDPGKNVVLASGLAAALAAWTASGQPVWQGMTDAQAQAQWDLAAARPATDPALGVFRAALLPALTTPAPIVQRLKSLPTELVETIRLAPAQTAAILAGQPAAVDGLRRLTELLRAQGLASALPLITSANQVLLVVGAIGLPEAGINLSERRAVGFRWHVVPIHGGSASVGTVGSRTTFTPEAPGLYAVVCIGYARRGFTDPYEYRVEMDKGDMLSLLQYEYLMNLLEHTYPLGVEVNTFSIRKEHVDLNGDGVAEPLQPTASRTYRTFLRPRYRG